MSQPVEVRQRGDYCAAAMTRTLLFSLLATTVLAAPAMATEMYPGQGITVNPSAVNGGYSSPYASGPYGNPYGGVIHLHMPKPAVHHHHVAAKPKPADTSVATTAPADTTPPPAPAPTAAPSSNSPYPPPLDSLSDTSAPAPPPKPAHHKRVKEATTPAPVAAPATVSTDSSGAAAMPLTLDPSNEIPPPAAPKNKHAAADKPVKTASAETAPSTTVIAASPSDDKSGLTRRSEVLFPRGDPEISAATVDKMRTVAADLSTLLGAGAQRVQLDAYGGAPGDKGSDARRLSLKRALGIRQLLIEDGIPSEKIDVRAMGGIDDNGAPDRVDILVRGG
jgi:outer membrane protein OmpA-like peptidoglycan-associated protein